MKKILLLIAVIAFVGLHNRLQAQACAVTNVSVELNSTTVSGGSCVVNINLTFNLQHNMGNKYVWIHLWKTDDYPNLSYGAPPTAAELAASLANIGINNSTTPPSLQTSYVPAPSVPVEDAGDGLTLAVTPNGASDIYKISNIQLTVVGGCKIGRASCRE